MKRILLILLLATGITFAQQPGNERIKAFKRAFITEQLNLSADEAEKFWPVYNEYEQKIEGVKQQERSEIFVKLRRGFDVMTEEEADELIEKSIEFSELQFQYQNEMIQELRKVISAKKVIKLSRVEEEFKRELLKQMQQRRRGNKN